MFVQELTRTKSVSVETQQNTISNLINKEIFDVGLLFSLASLLESILIKGLVIRRFDPATWTWFPLTPSCVYRTHKGVRYKEWATHLTYVRNVY